jgi:biopolymer transport protein ExbB
MSIRFVKGAAFALCATLLLSTGSALAQQAKSLDELLGFVKQGQASEARENRQREQRFANDKANQAAELRRAEAERARQEALSTELENTFEDNELLIAAKREVLKEKLGTLTELFGHLTSAAGDLASNFEVSLASAQYPGREVFLRDLVAKMSNSDGLPSIEEIERVWFELLREIQQTGVVTTFSAEVSSPGGERTEREVMRVGSFNIVDIDGNYLSYQNDNLSELPRQPSGPYTGWAADLASATSGLSPFGVDPTGPSGGSFLAAY